MQIYSWPFQSLHNSLILTLGSQPTVADTSCKVLVDSKTDEIQSLKWFTLTIAGVSLYGQFLNKAIIDESIRVINFTLTAENSVRIKLPHFWNNAVVDPTYSVLISGGKGNCGKTNQSVEIVEIVVPVVVVFIIGILVIILLLPRIRSAIMIAFARHRLEESSDIGNAMEIERITGLEVNSSAGKFVLQL
eukprot:Phypoly_transcript_19287.p1 GENE.Phypoly_transcript_19287~~Phypoly_transcript_19287.p1  ORF type:complete len:190 (+),score=20.11 Phypoly_transcript_19287:134-703(+)